MAESLKTRKLALSILHKIRSEGEDANDALEQVLSSANLDTRDRSFVMLLVMIVLRRQGIVNSLLKKFLSKPLDPEKMGYVIDVLHLGAVQILWLQTPPHAAVHSAVELVKNSRFKGMAKMVNAVLQNVNREGVTKLHEVDQAKACLPAWLWNRWNAQYGEEAAHAMARQTQIEPALDFTLKQPQDAPYWAKQLEARILPNGSLRREMGGKISELPGYEEGAWWIQDAGAAMAVSLLHIKPGETVLDLCAAPGGKTIQLALAGAQVTAVDKSSMRLKQVEENIRRMGVQVNIQKGDIMLWSPPGLVDAIVLDAPCSATGTLRRHPELAWAKSNDDVHELAALQLQMLKRAIGWLKPGGRLVYSVCSLEKEEGEHHVEALKDTKVKLSPLSTSEFPWAEGMITDEGILRTLPYYWGEEGGIDGFFAARFEKIL